MAEQLKGSLSPWRVRANRKKWPSWFRIWGTAVGRPAQGTVFLDDEALQEGLNAWINQPPYLAILTTGMGLDALFDMAERMGIEERFLEVLSGSIIAARGYKTVNALKKEDLRRRFVTTTEVQSD